LAQFAYRDKASILSLQRLRF